MDKDDKCERCGHRRELHRPDTDWTWQPGDDGPCVYTHAMTAEPVTCHAGDGGAQCPSFVEPVT